MRTLSRIASYICFVSLVVVPRFSAAEISSSWVPLGQAKIEKNAKSSGTIAFQPHLSLEDNNRILAKYKQETVTASVIIPASLLNGENWVNRRAKLTIFGHGLDGRVIGVMISPNNSATLFAQIENVAEAGSVRLNGGETGVLSIGK